MTTDVVHPLTGLAAIGTLADGTPIWPARGAADDDGGDDVGMDLTADNTQPGGKSTPDMLADDDDDENDSAEAGSGDAEWKAPTREEYETLVKERDELKLERAATAAEAKKNRLALRDLKKQQRDAAATAAATGDKSDQDAAKAAEHAVEEALRVYKPVAVRSAAEAALIKAGFQNPTDTRVDQMVRRLDMNDIDVDPDTGKIDGLDDQVSDLKDNFPELFEKPTPEPASDPRRARPPRINGADRRNEAPQPRNTGEKHMAAMGLGPYAKR